MNRQAYINRTRFTIVENETIYQFISRNMGEEFIPVLCHDENLENYGACRLCSVEVALKENGATKIMASCHTPVQENMRITTHSKKIERIRKNILELLLTNYPKESLRAKSGHNPTTFQSLLKRYNIYDYRYPEGINHNSIEEDFSHPYIHSDLKECIHCYKCVRVCDEVQGEMALGIAYRGFFSKIIKGYDENFMQSPCVSCGACVQICPTNALTDRYLSKTVKYDKVIKSICSYCGVGCNINIKVRDNEIIAIEGTKDAEVNNGHTCLKGRFAFDFYKHPDRLKTPLIRKNDKFVEATWQEAYELIEKEFKRIIKQNGPDALAGVSSARCTNEENYLMQKFFRIVLGTNNIDGCARVCHAPTAYGMQQAFGTGAATNSIKELPDTECILLIGANPTLAHPVTGAKIKQEVLKGKKLIVIDPIKIELTKYADVHLQLRPGTNVPLLLMFAKVIIDKKLTDEKFITEHTKDFKTFVKKLEKLPYEDLEEITGVKKELVEKAATIYAKAKVAMEFHGLGVTEHYQGSQTVMLIANIAMMTGNIGKKGSGINPLRGQNNVQGAADMGIQPHQGPGYLNIANPDVIEYYSKFYGKPHPTNPGLRIPEMLEGSRQGRIKGMWIIGEDILQTDPNVCDVKRALSSLEFLVVQEIFMTETAKKANVILPAACSFEKDGTFTNSERRIQRVNKAIEPIKNVKPDGQIITDIMRRFGYVQNNFSAKEVLNEISQVVPFFEGVTWENLGENGLQWPVNKAGKGTEILHKDGDFKSKKGKFHFFDYKESPELIHYKKDYPFILTTGRILEHYNCGTMTRRTPNGNLVTEDLLKINTIDAKERKIVSGDIVELFSPRGHIKIKAEVTDEVNQGVLYSTFHFPGTTINKLTSNIGDQETLTPEFKIVAADIIKYIESPI